MIRGRELGVKKKRINQWVCDIEVRVLNNFIERGLLLSVCSTLRQGGLHVRITSGFGEAAAGAAPRLTRERSYRRISEVFFGKRRANYASIATLRRLFSLWSDSPGFISAPAGRDVVAVAEQAGLPPFKSRSTSRWMPLSADWGIAFLS